MSESLTLDDAHIYRLNGMPIPGVTEIIKCVYPSIFQASEWHMNRGTATHYACELADRNVLAWDSVDPEILPRVQAWQRFRDDFPAEVVGNETKLYHPVYRFAGRIDRVFERENRLILTDLKNSIQATVRIQLGFYSLLVSANNNGRKVFKAVAVELLESGEPRCFWLDQNNLRRAEQQALATLTVFSFMKNHGLERKDGERYERNGHSNTC